MKQIKTSLAVVGGGPAGVCAALAAARLGLHTVLVHDRPVLGGNSSSEIRVWTRGATGGGSLFCEEMGIWGRLKLCNLYRNPECNPVFWDDVLLDAVKAQPEITLLLNTHVVEITRQGSRLQTVKAFQLGSEQSFSIAADYFIDATGDATLGALMGLPYEMGGTPAPGGAPETKAVGSAAKVWAGNAAAQAGAEPPATAPGEADGNTAALPAHGPVMGDSLFYFVKDAGRPVRFVPPDYAYPLETIERLIGKGGRLVDERQSGSDCWWFEYGGTLDTVADTQDITFELKRLTMGVWNYIKNSGKYDAARYTLEWIGNLAGKRESRRMKTEYMLTARDITAGARFYDSAFYGGWYLDDHPSGGFASEEDNCVQIPVEAYPVPLRCLYSAKAPNLLFAGRTIGTGRGAFVSTRIMNTCALSGQAAATLAWQCLQAGAAPAQLPRASVEAVRQMLLREDMLIPGARAAADGDAACTARISAGSEFAPGAEQPGGVLELEHGAFLVLPRPRTGSVRFCVQADAPAQLQGTWHAQWLPSRVCPGECVGHGAWQLAAGEQWLTAAVPQTDGRFAVLRFGAAPGVRLVLADSAIPCVLCGCADSPAYHTPLVRFDAAGLYAAENLADGFSRPWGVPHMWCSAPGHEPWVLLQWDAPQSVRAVRLYLDPDLSMELPSSRAGSWNSSHKYAPRHDMPPQLLRSFRLEGKTAQGWRVLAARGENIQRLVCLDLPACVQVSVLRLVVQSTWGDARAMVYRISVDP